MIHHNLKASDEITLQLMTTSPDWDLQIQEQWRGEGKVGGLISSETVGIRLMNRG
jgi:hypothetical protein